MLLYHIVNTTTLLAAASYLYMWRILDKRKVQHNRVTELFIITQINGLRQLHLTLVHKHWFHG